MSKKVFPALHCAIAMLLTAALFAGDADAKGGRRSGGSSSSASKSHAHEDAPASPGFSPSVNLRSSSSSSPSAPGGTSARFLPLPGERDGSGQAAAGEPASAEEEARRAANLAIYQRLQAEKAAAAKVAAEKAEEQRIAADREAAARNAQVAAEQRAAAARVAAAQEQKRREDAAVAADVDRVLQRARADYPMLATPEGQPYLRKIIDRQQQLVARGIYPSIAMVEAVSDHAHALVPPRQAGLQMVSTNASQQQAAQPRVIDGCRWVTPIKWACD